MKWIDVNTELPPKGEDVLCKVTKLAWIDSDYAVGYLKNKINTTVWKIEGRYVTHYKDAVNNCVTHWTKIIE